MKQLTNTLDTIAAFGFLGAMSLWSYNYLWSDYCFWASVLLIVPGFIVRMKPKPLGDKCVMIAAFIALIAVGAWWFNKPTIDVKIPGINKITISRQ